MTGQNVIPVDASSPALLEVSEGGQVIQCVRLTGEHLVIGRAPDAGLQLHGVMISRHHAEIFRDPFGRWWVRDLGSRNGIRFNGQRADETALPSGGTFDLGPYALTLRLPSPPPPPAPQPAAGDGDDAGTRAVVVDDAAVRHFSTLEEGAPPSVSAQVLSGIMDFAR